MLSAAQLRAGREGTGGKPIPSKGGNRAASEAWGRARSP